MKVGGRMKYREEEKMQKRKSEKEEYSDEMEDDAGLECGGR